METYLCLRWVDPVTRKRRTRSVGFVPYPEAETALRILEAQLLLSSPAASRSSGAVDPGGVDPGVVAPGVVAPPAPPKPAAPTLRDWLEGSYLPAFRLEHARKTCAQEEYLASWLAELLGHLPLDAITPAAVEAYKQHRLTVPTERLGRPCSPATVNGELRVLSAALRYAAELGVLTTPLPRVRRVTAHRVARRYLTPTEVTRLLEAARAGSPRTWLLLLVLANLGLRPGEAMTREWSDVDFEAGLLRVTHKPAIDWYVKGGRAGRGKERAIPLTPEVRAALAERWEALGRPQQGWVFPGRGKGGGAPQQECINGIQLAAQRAGLGAVHPHLLRHAWASRLAMAGVDRKSLQELGGWTDGRMLDEVYAHVTPQHLKDIMARSGIG